MRKSSPVTTGQTAREAIGSGIRLRPALPIGCTNRLISDVIAKGM
jgi:hypothetical protein